MWESSWMTLVSDSVCLSVCLYVHLPVRLSVCLSVHHIIIIYIFYLLQLVSMMACLTTNVSSGVLKCMVW